MSEKRIIVVAGAQGNLGKLVCESLMSRANAAGTPLLVRGLVRKGGQHAAQSPREETASSDQEIVIETIDYDRDDDLDRVCAGAYAVVSTLQGNDDVLVGVQSRLLRAAIRKGVRRFIPSDYSIDFTELPVGTNRNFDTRRAFHETADRIIHETKSSIEFTSIFQGAFTELLASGWVLLDYKKRRVAYFGSPDTTMEFTTWKDTAEYTAAVALDPNPTPRALHIAGVRLTPRDVQRLATRVTGTQFGLKRVMPVGALRVLIKVVKLFKPGKKDDLMPPWVGMQYALAQALGTGSPDHLDNDRYTGITWTGADEIIRRAFDASKTSERR